MLKFGFFFFFFLTDFFCSISFVKGGQIGFGYKFTTFLHVRKFKNHKILGIQKLIWSFQLVKTRLDSFHKTCQFYFRNVDFRLIFFSFDRNVNFFFDFFKSLLSMACAEIIKKILLFFIILFVHTSLQQVVLLNTLY